MNFQSTPIPGVRVIRQERNEDDRGFFARTWCRDEFSRAGIAGEMVQSSVSNNRAAGTVRGLHFTWAPSTEDKLVRCERGRIFDVILDLRADSPAYMRHFGITLGADEGLSLYVPQGIAHGFQTLVDDCQVLYMMTDIYRPELADGVRFDDPQFGIDWPRPVGNIADRDRAYPDFDSARHARRYHQAKGGKGG